MRVPTKSPPPGVTGSVTAESAPPNIYNGSPDDLFSGQEMADLLGKNRPHWLTGGTAVQGRPGSPVAGPSIAVAMSSSGLSHGA
jgi:hypothetical protein